ncbi:uncharacterized protein LOC119310748 [Triticum dicoccoides]|nr:uncharacterized protein LOC119310748 [Triticum dicoccoides]
MAPLPAPTAASAFLFHAPPRGHHHHHKPKPSSRPTTTLCSAAPSSTPSLADQLEPLSRTLLTDKPTPAADRAQRPTPEPTWVNPSRPRPTVLSLRRQRRRPAASHPSSAPLQPLLRDLRALPEDADLAPTLSAFFPLPGSPPTSSDALLLLNYLHPSWRKTLSLFAYLRGLPADAGFTVDTILFNVALKSLRAARRWDEAERLALDMVDSGVPLDNITYSTLITAARRCRQFAKAVEWFERMYSPPSGVLPDEVTYSAVLDVYAQLRMKEEVLALFDRARGSGWKPDHVAFAVLAKMFGEAGDYDGIQFVFKEMREVGIKPNIFVYNALLEALGKTGKPGLARNLFEEMAAEGVEPNARTLTAVAKIYGRARWGRDALQLWDQMRDKKIPADSILCNTLLSMCADVGLVAEAEQLFEEMKDPDLTDVPQPDKWSYTAMINIYGSIKDADRALQLFVEMLQSGIEANIMSYTIVIQCLGKANRIRDAVEVLEAGLERGLKPDDRLCGCLLSVVALSSGEETELVLGCLEKFNGNLVKLIRMLGDDQVGADELKEQLKAVLNAAETEVRRPYCNCLIDICQNHGLPARRPRELFRLAQGYGLYSKLHIRKDDEWLLDLRSLSVGAAKTAFDDWMVALSERAAQGQTLPQSFNVFTGSSTHKFAQGLASAFAAHLKEAAAPFRPSESQVGSFVSSRDELVPWLQTSSPSSPVVAGWLLQYLLALRAAFIANSRLCLLVMGKLWVLVKQRRVIWCPLLPAAALIMGEERPSQTKSPSKKKITNKVEASASSSSAPHTRDRQKSEGIAEPSGGRRGRRKMILAVLFANSEGNILIERFHGVPAEERLHWRSFLVKLGAENLKGAKSEELLVASHKSVSIVYTMIGDVCLYIVGKDEYDELALSEVIFAVTSAVKDVCAKPPTERLFLDKYGRICLCLDEIVWQGLLENTEKDRVRRLIRLKPPVEPIILICKKCRVKKEQRESHKNNISFHKVCEPREEETCRPETETMDLVNGALNWAAMPAMVAALLLFYPPYYLFKLCYSFLSYLFPDDLKRKVVLITGASSGIGEQLAYQYAAKGACLALVARKEWSLRQVADRAFDLGAPDVIILPGDVADPDDCNRFVQATVDHYGRLDHLVCNAGIASVGAFQEIPDVTNYSSQLDVNFWGAVQSTSAALPHLKRTRGRIVVTASATGWNPVPRMIFYNAANAALINFFETLRSELGSEVGITIVTPGWIESEMSKGKFLKEHGGVEVDQEYRDAQIGLFPVEYAKNCARAMVQAARQGDRYLTVPSWFGTMYLWRVFAPEVVEFCYRLLYMHRHGGGDQTDAPSKTMAQGGGKQMLYPSSLRSSDVKSD